MDAHDFWPPAVLVGPDGKPWHSWRVLLLPYLGHRDLFEQYEFSQPWDSAKNLRAARQDAAVVPRPDLRRKAWSLHALRCALRRRSGPGALRGQSAGIDRVLCLRRRNEERDDLAPQERVANKGPNGERQIPKPRIVKIEQSDRSLIFTNVFTDGRSNTIVIAAVSPDRKIPWTKPEDITVGTAFPLKLGEAGGIAAPHSFGKGPTAYRAAPVLFADGTSRALLDTLDPSTLYALLTRFGGEVISPDKLVEAPGGVYTRSHFAKLQLDCASGRATITEPNLSPQARP